uniref:Uncharacterized protein n=1 Tax=Zea mays TaxID=4577 RepID=B4FE58_MAIZE|nr:unknown [Zea mays]
MSRVRGSRPDAPRSLCLPSPAPRHMRQTSSPPTSPTRTTLPTRATAKHPFVRPLIRSAEGKVLWVHIQVPLVDMNDVVH